MHARAYPRVPLLAARAPPISRANCPLRSTAEYTQSMQPLRPRHAAQLALPGAQLHSNPFRVHDAASANVFFIPVYASAACRETATNHGRCAAGQSAERAATRTTQRGASRAAYNMGRGCAQVTRDSAGASRTWRVPRGRGGGLRTAAVLRGAFARETRRVSRAGASDEKTNECMLRRAACCALSRAPRWLDCDGRAGADGRSSAAPAFDRAVLGSVRVQSVQPIPHRHRHRHRRARACVCRCLRLLCGLAPAG